jgi:hypothetical protein
LPPSNPANANLVSFLATLGQQVSCFDRTYVDEMMVDLGDNIMPRIGPVPRHT